MTKNHSWAVERRLDFIDWSLATRGQFIRRDAAVLFGITLGIVSSDLTLFQQLYPDAMRYDKNVKSYMAERTPYRRRRKGAWVEAINWEIVDKIA